MSDSVLLVLVSFASLLVLGVALIAAWRLVPRSPTNISVAERLAGLEADVQSVRATVLEFADRYESAIQRMRGQRRADKAVERENAGPPAPDPTNGKAALWARARAQQADLRGSD